MRNPHVRPAVDPHMLILGIDGGPRAGQSLTVEVDASGFPPFMVNLDDERYVREPFGIEPHDGRWHYCHRPAPRPE